MEVWGDLTTTARGARSSAEMGEPDAGGSGDLVVDVAVVGTRLSAAMLSMVVELVAVVSMFCLVSRGEVSTATVVGLADAEPGVSS